MFELSHSQDEYESFTYTLDCAIGEDEENADNKVLAFHYASKDQVFIISNHRIDFYLQRTRRTAFKFNGKETLIFGKFLRISEREMILVVNKNLQMMLFDLTKIRHEVSSHGHQ